MSGKVDITQVARRAGVSITTVSRVLSPSGHRVNAKTEERVRAVARELNYAPSPLAQALAKGTSRIIGILVGDNDDPHFAGIIRGAEEVASREGYLIIVGNTERRTERELSYVRLLRSYRADGLVFIGGGLEDSSLQSELEAQVRAFEEGGGIVVATTQHRLPAWRVSVDSAAAAARAVQHLLDLGHTRIGFVAGPAHVRVSHVRAAGVRNALAERGLALDPRLVAPADFTRAGGEHAARRLLDLPPPERPTAIFA
ncbi:MAG: LacI family DNA-binding transcriptional regulator, partial [Chloroflexota bacterium]